jgi:sec-independent protein translocase protein TatB
VFDLGFGELLLIALVALVVLGPERLPKAARFAGLWVRRARAQWYSVKSELERELAAEELKRNLDAARTAATDFERQVRTAASDLDSSVREKGEAARSGLKALRDELSADVEGGASAGHQRDARQGSETTGQDIGATASDPGAAANPATRESVPTDPHPGGGDGGR